jgi:hypothetical protein
MPVVVDWHSSYPQRIILITLTGIVSLEDMSSMSNQAVALGDSISGYRVHNIVDTTRVEKLPTNLLELRNANRPDNRSKNLGWVLIVTAYASPITRILHFVITAMGHLFEFPFRMLNSLDEAEAFLKNIDETL